MNRYWLQKKTVAEVAGSGHGYARNCADNWQNVATGENGIPQNGDFIISQGFGGFGGDFQQANVFGGLTLTKNASGEFFSQAQMTLQAGGPGLVLEDGVSSLGTGNGYLAFKGSGDAIVDIRNANCTLYVQKSLFGNANITLVKKGPGRLKNSEGFAPLNAAKTAYGEARNYYGNYYQHRKFAFGGVKIQEGVLDMCQYYWVSDCDFQFDGNGVTLGLKLFDKNNDNDMGVHSLELQNCKLRETANVTTTTHQIYGDDARCYIHMFGTLEDTTFSGRFTAYAGLVWDPVNDVEFVFKKSVSPTAGILAVSNGTIRVTEGAGFPNVPTITVSGENAKFRVDASAQQEYSATTFVVENGGKIVPGGRLFAKAVTAGGAPVGTGVYTGTGTIGTVVDWVDGEGTVIVGSVTASEAAAVEATWNGSGNATTLANWNGAEALPALDNGSAQVAVAGGGSFVADRDMWVKGFAFGVSPFSFSAAAGKELWIGSAGIVNAANAALALGDANGTVVAAGAQTWDVKGGTLDINGDVGSVGDAALWVKGTGGKAMNVNVATPSWTAPLFVTNMTVKVNASGALGPQGAAPVYFYKAPSFAPGITVDRDWWTAEKTTLTTTSGNDLTFNGFCCTTNGQNLNVTGVAGTTITFNKLFMSRNGCTLNGAGTIVFKDSFHVRDRPNINGTVVVELHKDGNRLNGNMGTFSGGRLKAMKPYVITKANTRRQIVTGGGCSADATQNTFINAKSNFTLDLNGFDQSVDQLAMHADGAGSGGHVTSATHAVLHLQTEKSWWAKHNYACGFNDTALSSADEYGYETADKGYWEGGVTLSYEAKAGMIRSMMRSSSSTGNVEVVSGTLVFLRRAKTANETFDLKGGSSNPYYRLADEDGAWTNASKAVVKGGILKLEHSKVFGRETAVELTGGTLRLEDGVRQAVKSLAINGVRMPDGIYGSSESAAPSANQSALFAGKGVLKVGNLGMILLVR